MKEIPLSLAQQLAIKRSWDEAAYRMQEAQEAAARENRMRLETWVLSGISTCPWCGSPKVPLYGNALLGGRFG